MDPPPQIDLQKLKQVADEVAREDTNEQKVKSSAFWTLFGGIYQDRQAKAPRRVPKKKWNLKKTRNTTECSKYFGKQTTSDRTLTWCVPKSLDDPSCQVSLCFNVDEVREYIKKHDPEQTADCSATKCKKIPMFERDKVREFLRTNNVDLFSIDDDMPDEFREVVLSFDALEGSIGTSMKPDSVLQGVRKLVEEYVAEKMTQIGAKGDAFLGDKFGSFWRFTKKAASLVAGAGKFAWALAWKIIENPFWTMVITTIAKLVRIAICLYTSFPQLGEVILERVIHRAIGDIQNVGGGTGWVIYTGVKSMLKCLTGLIVTPTNLLIDCGSSFITANVGALANMVGQIIGPFADKLLRITGLGAVADFGRLLLQDPYTVYSAVINGDPKALLQMDIDVIVNQFALQDWNMAAILFFLSKCPKDLLQTMITAAIAYVAPALLPTWAIATANGKIHPIVAFQLLVQKFTQMKYALELIAEIQEWIFDLMPCLFRYVTDLCQYYFGARSAEKLGMGKDAKGNATTCCMTQLIVSLERQFNSDYSYTNMKKVIDEKYAILKARLASWWPFSSEKKDDEKKTAEKQINDEIAQTEALYPSEFKNESSSSSCPPGNWYHADKGKCLWYPPAEGEDEGVAGLEEEPEETKRKWTPGHLSYVGNFLKGMWAVQSDGRAKQKVFEEPLFTLHVEGHDIHFYVFVWNEGEMFADGYNMHISVIAQEIEQFYPQAVFELHGRKFLYLHRLPLAIVQMIIRFHNPVFPVEELFHIPHTRLLQ